MKAYTDIEQSKKLAEFLPHESADMWYDNDGESIAGRPEVRHCSFIGLASMNIPCWSLAALLETLPLEVETHKQTDGHKIYYYVESYMKRMEKEIYLSSERYENLVDACYEMILRMHEQKLL